jgi:hypothetical protein
MPNKRKSCKKKSPFQSLFAELEHVIALCRKKLDCERASNTVRQRWAEIIVKAATAYGNLYEKYALEDLRARIKALEAKQPKEA